MSFDAAPLSKTAKYKKITKPLLERKRRARINRCLDELKDLMVGALEIDDENLSKLEKADILELTVNHLTKLHSPKDPVQEAKKFQAGFGQCAAEACRFIMSVPDLDENVSQNLVGHLSRLITSQPLTIQVPERPHFSPPHSPSSVISDRQHYYSDQDRSSSDAEDSVYSTESSRYQPQRSSQSAPRTSPPLNGLLTTVDKLANSAQVNYAAKAHRSAYFNAVSADAKDAILRKIRQHIMDKRGNEINANDEANMPDDVQSAHKYLHKEDVYRSELPYPYSMLNIPSNSDTLDLRKVRSPNKQSAENKTQIQMEPLPVKADPQSMPQQCDLPMDYSNLPPKKKRKMLEYQEYKKQEEAKRQYDAFCASKKENGEGPSPEQYLDSKWRPW